MQDHNTPSNVVTVDFAARGRPFSAHSAWAMTLESARQAAGLERRRLRAIRARIDVVRKADGVEYVGRGDAVKLFCLGPNGKALVDHLCGVVLPTIAARGEYIASDGELADGAFGAAEWSGMWLPAAIKPDDWREYLLKERAYPGAVDLRRWVFDDVLPRLIPFRAYVLAA